MMVNIFPFTVEITGENGIPVLIAILTQVTFQFLLVLTVMNTIKRQLMVIIGG